MVFITEDLVRKKAEHNEGLIGTLEELSLHQEDVEKIEHLQNWCKKLQILYLQANQIGKIENLNKLKDLQYMNLAINNIEKIENLEKCESLQKLDLTLNFIGDLESVKSLKKNIHLRDLYLTGNPCSDYKGYRDYVVAQLPQLESLDVTKITKSERIKAVQNLPIIEKGIRESQDNYMIFRQRQKERMRQTDNSMSDEEFWQSVGENCPETRREIAKRQKKIDQIRDITDTNNRVRKTIRLFAKDGRPLNINQAKLNFKFSDDNPEMYILDISVYKYMDTSLIDIDLQPIYVKLTIKGKIFQICFPEEVAVERSSALRSQTTGHLVLKLPILSYKAPLKKKSDGVARKKNIEEYENGKREVNFLEVTGPKDDMDFSKIVEKNSKFSQFEDDPEVPPLEYG